MKPRKKKAHGSQSSGDNGISRTSLQSESEGEGIKILSSPKALADLEEENRKLKHLVTGSGRRLSSVLNDQEEVTRRPSHISNDSIAEPDAVSEREKLVKFESLLTSDIENHTEMNAVDEIGGDKEVEEEKVDIEEGGNNVEEEHVVDVAKRVDEKEEKVDEQVHNDN